MLKFDSAEIEQLLQKQIGRQIEIVNDGSISYVVTPFVMNDGDIYYIVLQSVGAGRWRLTDHGHTLMHLSYAMDYDSMNKGTRDKVISRALSQFGIQRDNDELFVDVDSTANLADALTDMLQAISRISDVTYLSREQVKDTFWEDFKAFLMSVVPPERITFEYTDPRSDPQKLYRIDAYINGGQQTPLYVFAINTNDRAQDATITLYEHERWGLNFQAMAIFRDQTEINRDVLARLSNVLGQQFSSLSATQPRIKQYLERTLHL